ncbi:MAG: tetratricopeptide repeat protein, partial [Verrucomicrobiota bacterium]
GFLQGRHLLRKCQAVAADDTSGGGTKVFGISIGGSKGASSKVKSLAKKDPVAALGEIEAELSADPFNAELNDLLHTCASQLAMVDTAEFALETIHEHRPQETKYLHKLAQYYMNEKKFSRAAGVYNTISTNDPTDSEAIKGEKDCMAKASMMESTQDKGGTVSLKMRDDERRKQLERQSRSGLTRDQLEERRDELLVAYQANQHDITVVQNLAATYEQLDDFSNAYSFYSWAFELSENDKTILSKADTMKHKANQAHIQQLEEAVAADPNNAELAQQLADTKASALVERIAECETRVQENPTDGLLRYDLGKAYFEAGDADKAIPHLQQAKSNPAIETKVLLLLGRTFDLKGMTDMAISQLDRASQKLLVMDGTKKEVLYQLGLLYQKAGNQEDYLSSLKQVYEADYNYRDVATRVEEAYS